MLSVCAFAIIQLPPGDYITDYIAELQMRGTDVSEAEIENLRHQYGLDKPLYVQYILWMGKMVRGNMGWSFAHHRPVSELLWERLPMTALISLLSLVFVYLVAVPIGIYSATHQYSFADYGVTVVGFVGLATPNFLLALVLMIVFFQLFGLKIGGLFSIAYVNAPWSFAKVLDLLRHLPVPIIVIGTAGTAGLIRVLRGSLLDELRKQYVVPIRLFVRGPEYQLWGLFAGDRHLFGSAEGAPVMLLGADSFGRDLLTRNIYAARVSLSVGLAAVLVSFVLGVILGGISGYFGGSVDLAIQRFIEFLMSLPTIPVWMGLSAPPLEWSSIKVYFVVTLILSIIGWTGLARVVRQVPGVARRRLRNGGADLRGARGEHHRSAPGARVHELSHRAPDPGDPAHHSRRDRAQLPGPRHPAPGGELGHPAEGLPERGDGSALPVADAARAVRGRGRANVQLPRRRFAGRRGPIRMTAGNGTEERIR